MILNIGSPFSKKQRDLLTSYEKLNELDINNINLGEKAQLQKVEQALTTCKSIAWENLPFLEKIINALSRILKTVLHTTFFTSLEIAQQESITEVIDQLNEANPSPTP